MHRMATTFVGDGNDDDEEDMEEYTDEEMERMKLRPGIERALDVEHTKALRRVGIEMQMITNEKKSKQTKLGTKSSRK